MEQEIQHGQINMMEDMKRALYSNLAREMKKLETQIFIAQEEKKKMAGIQDKLDD